jgi:hypothetical protein
VNEEALARWGAEEEEEEEEEGGGGGGGRRRRLYNPSLLKTKQYITITVTKDKHYTQ